MGTREVNIFKITTESSVDEPTLHDIHKWICEYNIFGESEYNEEEWKIYGPYI